MDSEFFSHLTIVVCTKDRLGSLQSLLQSCVPLVKMGNVNIVIVDSSNPRFKVQDLGFPFEDSEIIGKIQVFYEGPGIPRARNRALAEFEPGLVTFVDDDAILPSNFSDLVLKHFNEYPLCAGVAPRIHGMYKGFEVDNDDRFTTRIYKERVQKYFGKISHYGENFWYPETYEPGLEECEWLPGCCMTYNFRILKNLRFNTFLENGPGKSYAVGEDVDFSTRASDYGPLFLLGAIEIEHREAPGTRENRILMAKARGAFRAYLSYQKRISLLATLYHLIISLGFSLLRLLVGRPGAWGLLKENFVSLPSFLIELYRRDLKDRSIGIA